MIKNTSPLTRATDGVRDSESLLNKKKWRRAAVEPYDREMKNDF